MINCVITLSKWLWNHEPQASDSAVNVDNVMAKLIFNKRTDVNLLLLFFFTLTRPQSGQMPGINVGKRRRKLAVNSEFYSK